MRLINKIKDYSKINYFNKNSNFRLNSYKRIYL